MERIKLEDIDLQQIYDFIENGISENTKIPEAVANYLEMMDKVRGMHLRIDKYASKDAIVNHLIKVEGLSRYMANKLYDQTIEYFYCETRISKNAWRNVYAELMMKVIVFAIEKAKDASDAAKIGKMIVDLGKLRQLDQPDKEELPAELFQRPFKLYTTDAEALGMGKVNRAQLAEFIDSLEELSEAEKIQIKREAQILPVKVFLDEEEDPRKTG
jgi:hypothetical protein